MITRQGKKSENYKGALIGDKESDKRENIYMVDNQRYEEIFQIEKNK